MKYQNQPEDMAQNATKVKFFCSFFFYSTQAPLDSFEMQDFGFYYEKWSIFHNIFKTIDMSKLFLENI